MILLEDQEHNFSVRVKMGAVTGDLHARQWTQVRLPLKEFATASIHPFHPRGLHSVYFVQGATDDIPRTLIVDEIKIDDGSFAASEPGQVSALPAPQNVRAKAYDRHIDVNWDAVAGDLLQSYTIYRSQDGRGHEGDPTQLRQHRGQPHVERLADPFTGLQACAKTVKLVLSDPKKVGFVVL